MGEKGYGVWMSDYVKAFATRDELGELAGALLKSGYRLALVPQNPWQLYSVSRGGLKGGIYTNKHGEISMPREIYEYLDQEVRRAPNSG